VSLGIRAKLFLASLGLILCTVALADGYFARAVERERVGAIQAELFVRLALIERSALDAGMGASGGAAGSSWNHERLDALADELGRRSGARVTLISPTGEVVGDSEVDEPQLDRIERHDDRPEVRAALATGRGASVRDSATLGRRMMYAAVPITGPSGVVGVARIAMALDQVDAALASLRSQLALATALAIVVAVLMSTAAAQLSTRPLRSLIEAARRMAGGDLGVRSALAGQDEFSQLGSALDQMAGSLSTTLGALKAERDLLQGILVGMQEGVLLLDAESRIVLVNPALRAMLLLGPDVTGKTLVETVRHDELKHLLDEAGGSDAPLLGEIELAGLKPRRLLIRAAAQRGAPRGLLAVFVDVTDVRRLESLRRDFVSNASHELRTPVSSILSAAETLRDAALRDPAASARFVDIIVRNAERLKRLVDDLLDLSRIESREFELQLESESVGAVVQHALSLFRERADKKGIRLSAEVVGRCEARFDRKALEAILSNLVDNAVKYCPEGSLVTVKAIEAPAGGGARVHLSVEDTGPGIDAKHLPRIFERFYRVDAGRSREVGGTGLGLSIVKHLVEAMGGAVAVESKVGRGTAFRFSLPAS
jgi:two-component system, OmpR family, phosphate regulon sensor histidine kinase PhoR